MPINGLSLAVAGAGYPNKKGGNRQFELKMCSAGESVELRPEPRNPADPRAVAVYSCRGIQIGYINAERCGWISRMLGEGREIRAIFQNEFSYGAWIRVAFGGTDPVLPPMEKSLFIPDKRVAEGADDGVDPDPGFWPDEEA